MGTQHVESGMEYVLDLTKAANISTGGAQKGTNTTQFYLLACTYFLILILGQGDMLSLWQKIDMINQGR